MPETAPPETRLHGSRHTRAARWFLAASIVVIVPAGFASKFYNGPGDTWVNNSLGGVLYVVFFCQLCGFIWPQRKAILPIVTCVLAATCALETLQLWRPGILQAIRSTFVGRTLIGTTFSASDYFYYVVGALFGWLLLRLVVRK